MKPFIFYSDKIDFKSLETPDGKKYYVEGYISTGDPDLVNDIVTKSCMDDMLNQFNGRTIKLDFEHESFRGDNPYETEAAKTRVPLGKSIDRYKDDKGVVIKWELNPNWKKFDSKGDVVLTFKDIWTNIKNKFLDAFSIAYVPTKTSMQNFNGKSIRLLDGVNLLNVALTGNPVNPGATMSKVFAKSLDYISEEENNMEFDYNELEIKSLIEAKEEELAELKAKYEKSKEKESGEDEPDESKEKESDEESKEEESKKETKSHSSNTGVTKMAEDELKKDVDIQTNPETKSDNEKNENEESENEEAESDKENPEVKSLNFQITEIKSRLEELEKENKELKAYLNEPQYKSAGAEKKSVPENVVESIGPLDRI